MVDCNLTKNYFAEKARMAKCDTEGCSIKCEYCPLGRENNGEKINCRAFEQKYHQKAIEIVQKWSDEHPQQTMRDKFFELFPNAPKEKEEFPVTCPRSLGWGECPTGLTCLECWNRPYEE